MFPHMFQAQHLEHRSSFVVLSVLAEGLDNGSLVLASGGVGSPQDAIFWSLDLLCFHFFGSTQRAALQAQKPSKALCFPPPVLPSTLRL